MASVYRACLIALFTIATCGPSFAEQGTEAQREACTPDAFRLCMAAMPDSGRVEGCLRAAGPRLSPACYAVFYPPDQQAQTATQGRGREPRDVQRRPDRRDEGAREYGQRTDQPREMRRDDGFGDLQPREYQRRPPQPQFDDD